MIRGAEGLLSMDTLELSYRLSVSLAIGLLLGIERGWVARNEVEGGRAAGLRTLALSGLLGGVTGALARDLDGGGVLLGLVFTVFGGVFAFLRFREMKADGTFGATTVVAGYLSFALGAMAVVGDERIAAAAGVAAAGLLALKGALHSWLRRLTWEELRAGLVLLAMTLILLPLLPNTGMGPFGALNPHELWLMAILIALVSAAGYVAMKWGEGGRNGIVLGGIAGGFVSSTAVTLSYAKLAQEAPEKRPALVAGAILAGTTMVARVLLVAGTVNAGLLRWIALPLVFAAVGGLVAAFWSMGVGRKVEDGAPIELKNPFELSLVLKFTLLLAIIMLAAKALTLWLGDSGAYALAVVSGLADVDAITLTLARLGGNGLGLETAALAILLAAAVNTLAKVVLAFTAGGRQPARGLAFGAGLQLAMGVLGLALTLAFDPIGAFQPHLL